MPDQHVYNCPHCNWTVQEHKLSKFKRRVFNHEQSHKNQKSDPYFVSDAERRRVARDKEAKRRAIEEREALSKLPMFDHRPTVGGMSMVEPLSAAALAMIFGRRR